MRKILSCLLALALLLSGLTAFAEETAAKDVVVLYTNDVHCGIDENIGYAGLAATPFRAARSAPSPRASTSSTS